MAGVSHLHRLGPTLEKWKLARQWTFRGPTLRGAALLLCVFALGTAGLMRLVYPFLAVTGREATTVLVVEGWAPDFALKAALEEYRRGGYQEFYSTGGPLERGEPLFEYGSYAEVGRVTLEKLGAPPGLVRAVPAPKVKRDRTFISAVALRDWLRQQGKTPAAFNVMTPDAHARRTRLLFEKAFGPSVRIGIIATPDERFDGAHWWRYSNGVKTVMTELIGYSYARIFSLFADDLAEP